MKQAVNSPISAFIILAIVFYTFFSCNDNDASKEDKKQNTDTSSVSNNTNASPEQKEAELKDLLANLTPLGSGELIALLPASILGVNQENADFSSSTGAATVTAEYKINDSTKILLTLTDCAGPAGSGFLATQYLDRTKPGNESSGMKIIELRGGKAILESPADSPEQSLTRFTGNRYLVTVFGEKISSEELIKVAKEIEIK